MHSDDEPVGRVLDRRQALTLLATAGAALTLGAAAPPQSAAAPSQSAAAPPTGAGVADCVAKPEQVEGPYFVDTQLNRSDIRSDPSDGSVVDGVPFVLNLGILQIGARGCTPLKDAIVDIWQCDVQGLYSGVAAEGTLGKQFLRGYQTTDKAGRVRFTTVLPGWYAGRTIHIHVKVRTTGTDGNPYEFTSQLYFTEEFKASYLAFEPYAGKGAPDTTNDTDRFYPPGGDQMILTPRRAPRGYTAQFTIGMDLSDLATGDEEPTPAP